MSKRGYIFLAALGIILIPTLTVLLVLQMREPATAADKKDEEGFTKTKTGLLYKDLKVGDGDEAKAGKKVVVHYTGTFREDGKKFAVVKNGVSLQQLVDGLNGLGIGPRDLISILQAIKAAGAIEADIEVM